MSAPWARPVSETGYRTLSPASQARVRAQRAEESARRMREAFAGHAQAESLRLVREGHTLAAELLGGAR